MFKVIILLINIQFYLYVLGITINCLKTRLCLRRPPVFLNETFLSYLWPQLVAQNDLQFYLLPQSRKELSDFVRLDSNGLLNVSRYLM